jgi:nucleoside-diphosphate-sugar epimerase
MQRILVTGANGQLGSELVAALRRRVGQEAVLGADLTPPDDESAAPYVVQDVTDRDGLDALIGDYRIDTVFHLASLLSASGERHPDRAWTVNLQGLKHILDLARGHGFRIFWPSSIAVFGPTTPRDQTPQSTVLEPNTMYGITKLTGELLARYYAEHFGVDTRSLRYPGLISYGVPPGGGTTDYAVEMIVAAVEGRPYTCFVRPETRLPMMYMPDAVHAALQLMDADAAAHSVRTGYNLAAVSFTAGELADELRKSVPDFTCTYVPDARQAIADSWPSSIDDTPARTDWGWRPRYDLPAMVQDMIHQLRSNPVEGRL